MRNVSIARRYARALLELATEAGTAEKVHGVLQALGQAFESTPELQDFFVNPTYTRAQRAKVLDDLLDSLGTKDAVLANAVRLLNDRGRLAHLPAIARLYGEMADERAGRIRGKVTSAVPLPRESVQKLQQSLERITQRDVVLETQVNPAVLGGASAQVGSRVFDGTLRSQIEELRRQLKGA